MPNLLCKFNNSDNLSVEVCILELVKISLERKASAIAVRFDPKRHKIQVVDNGIGFSKFELSQIFNKEGENHNSQGIIFDKICTISNAVIITSRSEFSSHTYVKAVSVNNRQKLFEGYHRPSKGTTVTIYDFNSSEWNNGDDRNCSISYMIAAVAFTELKVSFSLRNDDQKKLILNIIRPHSPWEILKYMKNNQTHEISYKSVNQMIQKNAINFNTEESNSNEEAYPFSPLNVRPNLLLNDQGSIAIDSNIHNSPLSEWSNWSYKPENVSINKNANKKLFSSVNQFNTSDNNFIKLSQMSIWSDWSYHPENSNTKDNVRDPRYKFLPISIYKILPCKHLNLLGDRYKLQQTQCSSFSIDPALNDAIEETYRCLQNVTNIRICSMKRKFDECRISKNTIYSLQILRQVNMEFIVAISNENGKKLLIIIDQHAVHERIRYEWLIETYREKESYKFFLVKLDKDLLVPDIDRNLLDLVVSNKKILNRVGINIKSVIDSTTCIVDAVPKCFIKKIRNYNNEYNLCRLTRNVRQLIMEVADGLAISQSVLPPVLPITINNVIASEACHEAIKFGDPLNVKECTLLMQALQDTKAPTRCAHGRPSIIPLMDLSGLENRKTSTNVCISFRS